MRDEHWTAAAERTWEPLRMVGEDDLGRLMVPERGTLDRWKPLNLRNPAHWLPYLRSRIRNELVWLESGAPDCNGGDQ